CNFNNNQEPFCEWTQSKGDDGDWKRQFGPTPTTGTGPPGDYPDGKGHYIYQEADDIGAGQSVKLESPIIVTPVNLCVEFRYYMYGTSQGSELNVQVLNASSSLVVWKQQGIQSSSWLYGSVTVPYSNWHSTRVVFEAIRGSTNLFDIALDNVAVKKGVCTGTSPFLVPPRVPKPDPVVPTTAGTTADTKPSTGPTEPSKTTTGTPKPPVGSTTAASTGTPKPPVGNTTAPSTPKPPVGNTTAPSTGTPKPPVSSTTAASTGTPKPPATPVTETSTKPPSTKTTTASGSSTGTTIRPSITTPGTPAPVDFQVLPPARPPGTLTTPPSTRRSIISTETARTSCPSLAIPPRPPLQSTPPTSTGMDTAPWPTSKPSTCTYPNGPFVTCHTKVDPKPAPSAVLPPARPPGTLTTPPSTRRSIISTETAPSLRTARTTCVSWTGASRSSVRRWSPTSTSVRRGTSPCGPGGTRPSAVSNKPSSVILNNLREMQNQPTNQVGYFPSPSSRSPKVLTIHCPPNSHYEPCGSACPTPCLDSRPQPCDGPCVEGCQCDKGFILSGGQCVPENECGCIYNGNYYQPGDEFYNPDCKQKCRCNGNNHTDCKPWSCSEKEFCGLLNGAFGCHPTGSASCYVSGDPHYYSFDGRLLSFMGTCTYTLARSCQNRTAPWFSIEGKNEERGQKGASYLGKIYITVGDTTITLMKSRRTLVNGVRVRLPSQPTQSISVSQSGQYVLVQTSFGLTVRWDGNHYAEIIAPNSYFAQMCGLCGDYDGNADNDNRKPDGNTAANGNELGNSWQTKDDEDEECRSDNVEELPCEKDLHDQVTNPDHCGRIIDPMGAFRDCIKIVDPMPYFNNCVFDMCQYQGLEETLCDQLEAYTDACLSAGAPVHSWRTPQFCPLDCPPNSHYTLCASTCPPTCNNPFSAINCPERCVEGCECDQGFILSDGKCVPANQCGCVDVDKNYRETNETWYKKGCVEKCTCFGHDIIHCENASCLAEETCNLQDGVYGCHPLGREYCTASGDPHYLTFDNLTYNFMGTCRYTLAKVCSVPSDLPYFNVETTNEHRGSNKKVSYVKAVHVEVYGHRVTIMKNRRVILDERRVNLPILIEEKLAVRMSGSYVLLQTGFGLWVRYDGNHRAEVSAPSSYVGLLCGLCGNYNKNTTDDNLKADGSSTGNFNELGESWEVPSNSTGCTNSGGIDNCDDKIQSEAQKPTSCGILTDHQGPFKACHDKVPPKDFFDNCVYDLCGTGGDIVSLCFALQAYADMCSQAGVHIAWRNKTFCPLSCPLGSHYEHCGTACPSSCTDLAAPNGCKQLCVEGCFCDPGYVLSGDKCVPFSRCGCVDEENNYHLVGESWFTGSSCTRRCSCSGPNNSSCEDWQCSPAEECKVVDGALGCQTAGNAVCHVAGDPHYYTFDNVMHTFMGTCTYTLVEVCNSSMVTPFTITAKNEQRGKPLASYLRLVHVDVYGVRITLHKARRVLLNNERVRTPILDRIAGVSITTSGIFTVVETDFGLVVKFDGNHLLEIQVPGAYFGKVCGLCGNYNGEPSDEYLMPDGALASNVTHLGNSWKSEGDDDPGCQPDNREDLGPSCAPEDVPRMTALCEEMLSEKYQACHGLIDPKLFISNCLYDLCEYDGMLYTLCDNIQAYAEACKTQGVHIKWRNDTFCPLPCPFNSHYTECSSPCPRTCADIFATVSCERATTCVEGCECDPGFVLSDDRCVEMKECGCIDDQGDYHNVGDSWLTKHCETECTCADNRVLTCRGHQCRPQTVCALNNAGIRNCKPEHFDKCRISGDPHHRTFDGYTHHYQGKHTYTLVTTIASLPSEMEAFRIEGKNMQRRYHKRVSFLEEVYVHVYGYDISFLQRRKLVVNGEKVKPPFQPREGLKLFQKSRKLYLETDFGLSVTFDGGNHADIVLPSTYRSQVLGLCGNYDRNRKNEYMKPDGSVVRNLNTFGDSWRVSGKSRQALPKETTRAGAEAESESGFETQGCSVQQLEVMNSTEYCGALSDPQGPFKECHSAIPPVTERENCVFDLCSIYNDTELKCQSYTVYAQGCQEQGILLGNWRTKTRCRMECPLHSTYKFCMSACPSTCADLAAPSECSSPCLEGCECDEGYVLSDLDCVPFNQCGCKYFDRYYQLGENFMNEDCSEKCTCKSTGPVCQATHCVTGDVCVIFNFTRGCYKDGPCLSSPCLNGGTCAEGVNQGVPGFKCSCPDGFEGNVC
uniref:Zonadhesin n=1 Tax=Latimeria chalumnae TaxID=7897 RepID=H3AS87_LATCH